MARKYKKKTLMDQLFKTIKNIIKNFNKLPIFIQLFISLAVILLFFKKNSIELFQNKAEITFIHMNGCGHCEKMKPEWDDFENSWDDSEILVNNKEQNNARELCDKHKVSGFPTVLFTINGEKPEKSQSQEHVFNGERTSSGFTEWANKMKQNYL